MPTMFRGRHCAGQKQCEASEDGRYAARHGLHPGQREVAGTRDGHEQCRNRRHVMSPLAAADAERGLSSIRTGPFTEEAAGAA